MNDFQEKVRRWIHYCLGTADANDRTERNNRFLEESLELVQSLGATRDDCIALVDYVFSRPLGDPSQEVGGVLITLAALSTAHDIALQTAADLELRRVWKNIDTIRAKHAAKPRNSPLPGPSPEVKK